MKRKSIRAMIIEDSALMRNVLTKVLSSSNEIEVVGTAINGKFGLKKLNKLMPDIIILDLEMPEMNGIDFLKEKNKIGLKTPIIILSAHAVKGAKITLDALSLGASDFILKPSNTSDSIERTQKQLIEMVLALAEPGSYSPTEIVTDQDVGIKKEDYKVSDIPLLDVDKYLQPLRFISDIDILSIGISTGGPNALRKILPSFSENLSIPIVVVQHMPAGFTFEFARSLDQICPLSVKEAEDNDILKAGRIYIAPGNKHVFFEKKKLATVIRLDEGSQVNGHRPSADVLFKSTAEVFGKNAIGCIMTGMGKDGASNIGMILNEGGVTIAQDQETSIVFGMPKIAIQNKNIQLVRPLSKIAGTINKIIKNKKVN